MRRFIIVPLGIVALACGAAPEALDDTQRDSDVGSIEEDAICTDCSGGVGGAGGGGSISRCTTACNASADCGRSCTLSSGAETTCGAYGVCRSCASVCGANAACSSSCNVGSTNMTCGDYGSCKRYDVYCGYPVITATTIADNNESGTGGAVAYMYFGSAPSPKTGTFASLIGGLPYNRNIAWASNFRGPYQVTGESSRPQWEFYDSAPGGLAVNWGSAGTPYLYGRECRAVPTGSGAPVLTPKQESVYEDDECFGPFCNPDDYVGSFTVERGVCNDQVFAQGLATGWSTAQTAAVSGDVSRVHYKLWCYSCQNVTSTSCSNGVQP